ncbi:MAG: type I DNA topoisomerase [Firmicutes bacterium]|jgi:DNA topoisomerase-1|nr:type I DNA topoisomerase [Bacillota bacterium]MDH7494926.1 type I DNA topoisomerase [Bacillota bacterium]
MSKSLVIVESPAKAKTIGKFLGSGFTVKASKGHVRDLPKSKLGVDLKGGYAPHYVLIKDRGDIIRELKGAVASVDGVLLATDPDREGEAISWHLTQVLGIDPGSPCRIEFNEITRTAVRAALGSPRPIDMARVNAQQARRVLDRLVGYGLSPLLWKKVRRGLSAGRVQSVAVRLVCDREREIQAHVREEYWSITAHLLSGEGGREFPAKLVLRGGKKVEIRNEGEAGSILKELEGATYLVEQVSRKERRRNPSPPFTTSTMQQEASRRLGFGSKKTMMVAQQLYEGLPLGDEGSVGLVTYIRTDSVRVAAEAEQAARAFIVKTYGREYAPGHPRRYRAKTTSQDAHEAIRPTNVERLPDHVKQYLTRDQYRLYRLIWERFVASQMESAVLDAMSVDVRARGYTFRATGSRVKFPGFAMVYQEASDTEKGEEQSLPEVREGEELALVKLEHAQHFTEPPPRYTEATLVKALEENGIGRPSTYAPIIDTILRRGYVVLEDRRFHPTQLGFVVVDVLKQVYPQVVDVAFTADVESKLDRIAEGELDWVRVVDEFYVPFQKVVTAAEETMGRVKIPDEVTDEKCPECGRPLVVKHGRFGTFLGCQGYPDCTFTKKIVRSTGVACPECGAEVVERRTKKGRKFYGCSRYPDCRFTTWYTPLKVTCPKCGAFLVKRGRGGGVRACVRETCDYREEGKAEPGGAGANA